MSRLPSPFIALVCVLGLAATSGWGSDFMTLTEIDRLGLSQAWNRNLNSPAGLNSIVEMRLHVHGNSPDQYVQVVEKTAEKGKSEPTVHARILIDEEGKIGGLPDRAEAERLARNEIRRLKRRGIEAEITPLEVPRIRLYVLTDDGSTQCRNAETGELMWLQRVGDRIRGYTGIGVDDDHVSVINGGQLVELDAANGQVHETINLLHTPLRGATHCGGYAIVPSVGPRVVCYPLNVMQDEPFIERFEGASLALPGASVDSPKVAWGTAAGFVYVMELSGTPNVQFRLGTDGIVSGTPASAPGERFFFGSEAGQIYAIKATRSGEVLWNRPTGQPIYQTPVVADEQVLFVTGYGNLMSVSVKDGFSTWDEMVPGVTKVIGMLSGQLFVKKASGAFNVLSLQTGELIENIQGLTAQEAFINRLTDRIYLIDRNATVQCLRPADKELPTIYRPIEPAAAVSEALAETKPQATDKQPEEMAAPADPFGAGNADPFGGGNMADPFAPAAGGDDPFGASPF